MVDHVYIGDIAKWVGEKVTLRGWLSNRRSSGKIHFILVRDGTGVLQATLSRDEISADTFELADRLPLESSIEVEGVVRADRRAPGGYELSISHLRAFQQAMEYPIGKKEHGVGFLMAHRHLWLRSSRQQAIMRIRHEVIRSMRQFFDERGFLLVDAPVFTPSACEGTTTLFQTDYFGEPAYLSQSGQLYNEAAAMAFGKVYCFGPTFRAEKSKTRRHLTEFWQIEPEVAYAELDDLIELAESFIVHVVRDVLENRKDELEVLKRPLEALEKISSPFPRISYDDAVEILKKGGMEFSWGQDFGTPDETCLSEKFEKPVFVHHYPAKCKAFYMKRDPANEELALAVDLLAPEGYGEIIGGGQREDDLDTLKKRLKEHHLREQDFEWYLDLRRYGSVPHSGFGLGLERALAWICKVPHVRETIPFPRLLEKVYP
ncbi:asparagine--tRNA ligase [candidate division TA06 bacterium DG_26]|uniref:Asparagine--tRNA ligase n=1 Tax=candidate division TA06 bacterium DG_26 TaxID=1703771 RepID=A0A0S7WKP1_UNCT6|nr:MAG: asparagine--tRNA ligase [candidate division TA06 bacterium DG_26]